MNLRHDVRRVARRARGLVLLSGASWVLGTALVALVGLGSLDYFTRVEDRGLRWMAGGLAVVLLLRTAWTRLLRPLAQRWSDVTVARRIETSLPELGDRLSTAVSFQRAFDDDPREGSSELRKAVIALAEEQLSGLNLAKALRSRGAIRSAAATLGLGLLTFGLYACDPVGAGLAAIRLTRPWEAHPWPKRHQLVLREVPRRLAAGTTFEVVVADARGRPLPDDARLIYRYDGPDGTFNDDPVDLRATSATAQVRKENVQRPFLFRAVGGDDDTMAWHRLEVAEPPAVAALNLELEFPNYTGWPRQPGSQRVQAIIGTRVGLQARTTKSLRSANLCIDEGSPISLPLAPDGRSFTLPTTADPGFLVERSGTYRLELEDREGFSDAGDVRYEIQAIADQPPRVEIVQPPGTVYVTPAADIPIRISAQDDLALASARLKLRESSAAEDTFQTFEVWHGGPSVSPERAAASAEPHPEPDDQELEYRLQLAELRLAPGAELVFTAEADDYLPQTGSSQPRRLIVVSTEDFLQRLAERQSFLLGELSRVLDMERQSRGQTRDAEVHLRETGQLGRPQLDQLKSAQLAERQVRRALTEPDGGVAAQVASLLSDVADNHLDAADVTEPLTRLGEEIGRLDREHLTELSHSLSSAIKATETDLTAAAPASSTAAPPLTSSAEHQDAALAALERWVEELARWDNFRRFRGELTNLSADQRKLAEETSQLARETLTKPTEQLTPDERAEAAKLGDRQKELARRFERVEQQMAAAREPLESGDPLAADAVSDALQVAREREVAATLRRATERVDRHQLGQALTDQQSAEQGVQEMLDALANRPEQQLERLVQKLREAEAALTGMRQDEAGLKQQLAQTTDAEKLGSLADRQQQLRAEAEALARRLHRLQAEAAERRLADAAARMNQAGESGQQGDSNAAAEQAQQAEQDLGEAQQQLAERRRKAEADLAAEQLARLTDGLTGVRDRQKQILDETQRLEGLRESQGRWTRAQTLSVRDLAREQGALDVDARKLSEQASAAEVFRRVITQAAGDMHNAAKQLEQQQTGDRAQRPESAALARFERLLTALRNDPPKKQAESGESGGGQGGGSQPPQQGIPDLAQLKMLKLMQDDLNVRTATLEQSILQQPQANELQREDAGSLAREQGELAELLRDLVSRAEAPAESSDALPSNEPPETGQETTIPEDGP